LLKSRNRALKEGDSRKKGIKKKKRCKNDSSEMAIPEREGRKERGGKERSLRGVEEEGDLKIRRGIHKKTLQGNL